jgi:hypothetical protein
MTIKRTIEWTAIFGTLGAFTLFAGAAYAQPKQQLLNDMKLTAYHSKSKHLIYFEDEHGRMEREEFVCAITQNQLSQLQSVYAVNIEKRKDDGHTITVAVVTVGKHNNTKQLKQIVGASVAGRCQSHIYHSVLYFFTVPSLS